MLTPSERLRVDAAGEGLYRALHRDSLEDVIRDLKERRASAVVVSVSRCGHREAARVAMVVREFPRVPAVAILTELEPRTAHNVLSLGRSGLRTLIDVRQPDGWRALREAIAAQRAGDIERIALAQLTLDLAGAPEDCVRFFEQLFRSSVRLSTIRAFSRHLGVLPSTLMSRFFRLGLPAPERYLARARLTRAARLFENPGLSVANVSKTLEYSSPQSFGRHVRAVLGMTALEFRRRYDGDGMLQRFREELVLPYLPALRQLRPLYGPVGMRPPNELTPPRL
jgi:AraC-like DNA-binding protein